MIQNAQSAMAPGARLNQVEEQTKHLEAVSHDLEKMVEVLEGRLGSVIVPQEPSPVAPTSPEVMLVPLAAQMREHTQRIDRALDRLRSLNSRIELPN
jgi:hypothetical protein